MLSPGNPTYSAQIIGGVTQSANRPQGHPVNFGNLLIPGTVEYTRWQAFLALLAADFKQINGPVIVRPFPELNSDWKWWGAQPPAQFIGVWQQMVTYMRNAGVTNVLWCLNFGATALTAGYPDLGAIVKAYYPGDAYVDIVSLDSYPPSAADSSAITALTATGKPVIFSEMGSLKGPIPVPDFTGNTGTALATLIANFPQVVAAIVWPGTEALPVQNGMAEYMDNPKIVNLSDLPPNLF
jgi:mannan endo-1,4-beta-mannosidase